MKEGNVRLFKRRDLNQKVIQDEGRILSVGSLTMDGIQVVVVQFRDIVRKYSMLHLSNQ